MTGIKKKTGMLALLLVTLFIAGGTRAWAEEITANSLQKLAVETEVKESADTNAAVVATLDKDTSVIVTEITDDEWCLIQYQEIQGYVPIQNLENYVTDQSVDALDQEFEQVGDEAKQLTYEYELALKEKRTSQIWAAVIALLVVAIFAVGIVSAVKKNEKERKEKES